MIRKTPSKLRTPLEYNWREFSPRLSKSIISDYMALRILYYFEPVATIQTEVVKAIDIVERLFKLFLLTRKQPLDSDKFLKVYLHDVEKLRVEAAEIEPSFNDEQIKALTQGLDDKGGKISQILRYGSLKDNIGIEANLDQIILTIDKVFFDVFSLQENTIREMILWGSNLYHLTINSRFCEQTFSNKELLTEALSKNNLYWVKLVQMSKNLLEDRLARWPSEKERDEMRNHE
jgi:hypothetical protein